MRAKALALLATVALLVPLGALPAGSAALCFGQAPTFTVPTPGAISYGTAGNDVILGTDGPDTIYGGPGHDRICGLGGDDALYGEAGVDRISGGDGSDTIEGGIGYGNVLVGGGGDDTIVATWGGNEVNGKAGDDFIDALGTSFSTLRGGTGRDTILSGYRDGLDAGPQRDFCGLGIGTPGTNCEKVELYCGTGGDALPAEPPDDLTTANADFDGNGIPDTLYVWHEAAGWTAHVETDGGFGAAAALPTLAGDLARAVGGHDVNRDGIDEAFVVVGTGAYTNIIGLFTLYESVGAPFHTCGLEPVTFSGAAAAEFPVGASVMNASGLACTAGHLAEYQQSTVDGTTFTQYRYDYGYTPGFATAAPALTSIGSTTTTLVWPTDQAAIQRAGQLHCGSLGL